MSDMKYDAIVGSGISVDKRLDLPSDLVPLDGMVEIQAKVIQQSVNHATWRREASLADPSLKINHPYVHTDQRRLLFE